ncbi:MAG: hypothetical protein COX19_06405 [Desulfobacterales bacterium CG23_combo_of_CG06-09_8_20_14_all_51_8]|nr:MAG: hypothetical protein COX19_06405 [Desulfobacterales bacterium CG23_combo_of_CG06-09_8_20_14_all_51_8]
MIQVAVSIGELVDKVSILAIKLDKIKDPAKLHHIEKEYDVLMKSMTGAGIALYSEEFARLREINAKLWDIEDRIRLKEAAKIFDEEFIDLARSVYFINDDRAAVKKTINLKYGSGLVEEKEYAAYK